jgi:2-polyprenyl-6-methoxyphenol hydroxylase-like FAD-dependent oxidoreductase
MHFDYDVVIVGARCAGASTAMLLARQGHRVLMVDRARFPSEIPHGHFIHRHGPPRLARWGLLDRVVASGCPPVSSLLTYFGDFRFVVHKVEVDGVAWGYGPRRSRLDKILIDAAVEAGAHLLEGVAVESLLMDDGRVVGIRTASGTSIGARLTIGADGRRSLVARQVAAPAYETVPPLMCWYFTYFDDVPQAMFEMHVLPERRVIFSHPTNDNLLAMFVGWPIDEFGSVRSDIDRSFYAALDLAPGLGARVRAGQRVERYFGTADLPNFLKKPYGPGWALGGDAGCHKDPLQGRGVGDALLDADLLADAVHSGLSEAQPLDVALANYELRRNEAMLPGYYENIRMAHLRPMPPEVLNLRRALRDKPADATRYFLAIYGRIPDEDFFNPTNLERIVGSASRQSVALAGDD